MFIFEENISATEIESEQIPDLDVECLVRTCLIATIKRGKEAGSDSVENDDPGGVRSRDHRDKWARDTCRT